MCAEALKAEIAAEAARLRVEPAALAAVIEVESAGRLYARIAGRDEPLIRFEGHWFDRRLVGAERAAARAAGLSDPRQGAVRNPATQAARWTLLGRAMRINRDAALESTSWGIGQVMGGNWKTLGFASVEDLVDEARSGAAGQLRLMLRHIEATGLVGALRRRDWRAFARAYNGPGYRANAYDARLATAYARHTRIPAPAPAEGDAPSTLRNGDRGEAVADLQRRLSALGFFTSADGVFGPATRRALVRFQKAHGLPADGIAGPATRMALERELSNRTGFVFWSRLWSWLASWWRKA